MVEARYREHPINQSTRANTDGPECLKTNLNASRPYEHPPDRVKIDKLKIYRTNTNYSTMPCLQTVVLCGCGCCAGVVIPFILDVRLVDAPAGVTQDFSTFLLRCCLP